MAGSLLASAQNVGINVDGAAPHPSALLDVDAAALPTTAKRGLLIPRVSAAEMNSIAAPANGLLVYNTTAGGFWYWNGTAWVPVAAAASGTLDQAYDSGGAGAGRTITADAGAVSVQGTDGLHVTGTYGNGATIDLAGAGTRMFFNPRKAAFRAGRVTGAEWNDANVGGQSAAWGLNTTASDNLATAWGGGTTASGSHATAWGSGTTASGSQSTAWGIGTTASGNYATAWGHGTTAPSFSETSLGRYNTIYVPVSAVAWNAADRLFTVGNGASAAARSDALVVLKSGNTGIGTDQPTQRLHVVGSIRMVDGSQAAGRVLTSSADGTATWSNAGTLASGTLDQAYDFGGAGAGRTITADAGAVSVQGTDGLHVTGTYGSGATIDLAGAGTRMFFNPRKAASRAGRVTGAEWNEANVGNYSMAWGYNTTGSGPYSTAWGYGTTASGVVSTAWGETTTAQGYNATAWGLGTEAPSFVETSLGRYNTTYAPASATAWNAADRLFTIGSGTSDAARSNALVLLKNGNMGLGNITPTAKLDVDGQVRIRGGAPAAGRVLTSSVDGTASWSNASTVASGTLNQAYDFGGAGAGRTITADAGAVSVQGTDGFQVTGSFGGGATIALAGAGTRMFFNPRRAAFRAGRVTGAEWNDANVGVYSMAWGQNTTASVLYATAWGQNTIAAGNYATAWGLNTTASELYATAWGWESSATGQRSTAWGYNATASGLQSTAWGASTTASETGSTAWGSLNTASGPGSTAWGWNTTASGNQSTAWGNEIEAPSFLETSLGRYNTLYVPASANTWNNADRLFTIGRGTNNVARSNALTLLKNGNMALGNITPAYQLHLSTNPAAKPGSNVWTVVSDARLKRDIGPFTDGMDVIRRIDPVWYTYNGEAGMPQERFAGALAQEIQQVAPYMVHEWTYRDPEGREEQYLAVDYGALDFVVINALKEQQAMIDALRREVEALRHALQEVATGR
ncbi:MAG: tail fiber domain-containing protein [Flavobacteriales bacterium]|jgi:hypothetical protein|nr:tail fiber domain-containing protein [Flavobacteriales bacterium]